ncbi:AMP-dependent synthetase/ligase, partial [Metarhizium majus ARSEF 297]
MFKASRQIDLPTKDILSYIFDEPDYDQDKPVYVDTNDSTRTISCNQARVIIRQLIAGLRAAGVKPGDCIAIHSFNDISYSMLVLAIIGAGGIFTGTNPAYTAGELSHHIKTSRCSFLISEPEILNPLLEAARDNNIPDDNIWIFNPLGQQVPAGRRPWTDLLKHGEQDWLRFDDHDASKSTTAARLFSSGTTGLPKAVTITHYNLIAQHELVVKADHRPYEVSHVVATPIFHAAAAPTTHVSALASGHVVFMMRRFELKAFLHAVETFRATELVLVPPIAIAILTSPYATTRPFLATVRNARCGAAPLDKQLQARLQQLLSNGAGLTQVWGMTETSCVATMFPYGEHDDTGSVGRIIPNVELKLVGDDGREIRDYGVRGEICVRGPTVTPGYFDNTQANADSFDSDGWYKTGDIGYCDDKTRKWYIVDRKKELIKVRGFQVAPSELEAVIISHPQVIDAAVIGVALPGAEGEFPRAFVVRRPGSEGLKLDERAVREYMESRLAKYKALTGGVKFVDAIAKNASGKILKRLLREQSKSELEVSAKM